VVEKSSGSGFHPLLLVALLRWMELTGVNAEANALRADVRPMVVEDVWRRRPTSAMDAVESFIRGSIDGVCCLVWDVPFTRWDDDG